MMKYLVNLSKSLHKLYKLVLFTCNVPDGDGNFVLCEKDPLDCLCKEVNEPLLGDDRSRQPSILDQVCYVIIMCPRTNDADDDELKLSLNLILGN